MEEKRIRKIIVEGIGEIHENPSGLDGDSRPIEVFTVNGEMALVNWYRQGKKEYNGKFVIMVEYF